MLSYRLRHVVKIQHPENSQDPITGEIKTTWQNIELSPGKPDMPAEVLTGAGREFIAASAKQAEADARINLRWFPYPVPDLYQCRILWEGQIFSIISVETDITARREWRLRCKAGVSNGF